jgi:hypothetical protein
MFLAAHHNKILQWRQFPTSLLKFLACCLIKLQKNARKERKETTFCRRNETATSHFGD